MCVWPLARPGTRTQEICFDPSRDETKTFDRTAAQDETKTFVLRQAKEDDKFSLGTPTDGLLVLLDEGFCFRK